jgi:DNA-binding phage protein
MPKAKRPHLRATKSRKPAGEARYLAIALETGGPRLFMDALKNVVQTQGADRIAKAAGVSQRGLARTFSSKGRREVAALLSLMEATAGKLKLVS